jgi:hypothetical protein
MKTFKDITMGLNVRSDKNAGSRTIKAEVVPEKHITTIDTKWEG